VTVKVVGHLVVGGHLIRVRVVDAGRTVGALAAVREGVAQADDGEAGAKETYRLYRVEDVDLDPPYRRRNLGKAMYLKALALAGRAGAWLMPDVCGGTSVEASRVWASLGRTRGVERRRLNVPGEVPFTACRLAPRAGRRR